ncbi:hypothetical protein FCV25MIE_16541 [Fagus crenata]
MNPDVCIRISRTLGTVEQVENIDKGRGGVNDMKVCVLMNVEQPLCREPWYSLPGFSTVWPMATGRPRSSFEKAFLWLQLEGDSTPDYYCAAYGWCGVQLPRANW